MQKIRMNFPDRLHLLRPAFPVLPPLPPLHFPEIKKQLQRFQSEKGPLKLLALIVKSVKNSFCLFVSEKKRIILSRKPLSTKVSVKAKLFRQHTSRNSGSVQ